METGIIILVGTLLIGLIFFGWLIRKANKESGGEKKKWYWGFK